jgi:hypothetical protein
MLLAAGFSPLLPEFDPKSGDVGFMMGKIALGQVFAEYFCFPYLFAFLSPTAP